MAVFRAYFHGDFDGSKLLVFIGDDADTRYIANVDTIQAHGSALAEAFRVVEIAFQEDAFRKQASRAGHQKQEHRQSQTGDDDRDANSQLRPLQLLLARQMISSSCQSAGFCPIAPTAQS